MLYHPDCADELGGCGTLGCAKNGIGPSGPASLEAIRRHVAGVQGGTVRRGGGRGGGYPGTAFESERAAAIREALLQERARLLAGIKARRDFERGKVRKARLELLLAMLALGMTLYFLLREFI